jgi:hypothetical protein
MWASPSRGMPAVSPPAAALVTNSALKSFKLGVGRWALGRWDPGSR